MESISKGIADNPRNSYLIGLGVGLIIYTLLLYFNDWNPISLITSVFFIELSVITGIIMRFLGGLGLTLTYAALCATLFKLLSSFLRGKKSRLTRVKVLVLIPALAIVIYALYTVWEAFYLARELSYLEFLSIIFGIWSLMVMVYFIPIIRGEYQPVLENISEEGVGHKLSSWKFSIWRSYQSRLRHDYGLVAAIEFERYGARLFVIRAILSGLLLLPISLVLTIITPLAILSILLWFRVFTLDYRYFSKLERALLIIITMTVAILSTISYTQFELATFNTIFIISYSTGLLAGLLLLLIIILRK